MKAGVLALALCACGGQSRQIDHARQARYDADLPTLLAQTEEVVRRWYTHVDVDPGGTIRTSWQQLPESAEYDQWYETQTTAARESARTKEFVRFHIAISPVRPSRIAIIGHSAFWRVGMGAPQERRAEDERPWTKELADKLRLKIHAKLERFAR